MATDLTSARAGRTLLVLGILAFVGLAISFALPKPPQRLYPQRIPVRFWHMWTAEWKAVVDDIADRFNKSQDKYEVIALSIPPSGGDTKFVLAVAGGDPPDVMAQWNPVIPSWVDSGLLQPLDEMMPPAQWQQLRSDMYPIARKIGLYKDHLYGVTVGLDLWACYYRPDDLRAAGVPDDHLPATLEDLFALGARLDRFDGQKNLTHLGFLPSGFLYTAPLFGNGFYDWQSGKLSIYTPDNLRALQTLANAYQRLGYDNVARFQAGINQSSFSAGWPFISGHYSICIDGQWRVEQIAQYAPKLQYKTAPPPAPAGGRALASFANGNFMIIPKGARCPAGAWEFVKFWSGIENPQRAAELYTKGGWLPLMPAITNAPAYQAYLKKYPQFKTFVDMLPSEYIQTTPPVPYTIYLTDRVSVCDDLAMRGIQTCEQALRGLEKEIAQEQARRKEFGYAD